MEIRKLQPADAPLFQALRLAALQEAPTAFGSSYEEERDRPLSVVAARLEEASDQGVLGAFDGERLIGTLGLFRERHAKMRHKGMIWGMYVEPNHRRSGVGKALLLAALEFANGIPGLQQVNLSVNSSNKAALSLYESLGFHAFGVEQNALFVGGVFYDETHMVRVLTRTNQEHIVLA